MIKAPPPIALSAARPTTAWKAGPTALKWLKIIHMILIVPFLGGMLCSTAIILSLDLTDFNTVNATYKTLIVISDHIVRYGGIGTLLLAFVYGAFTNWGFFKHRWLTFKWIAFVGQTLAGILIIDKLLTTNMALLASEGAAALSDPIFLHNHQIRQMVVFAQIALTAMIIVVSVFKPWRSKQTPRRA